jgi:hypothetical protein
MQETRVKACDVMEVLIFQNGFEIFNYAEMKLQKISSNGDFFLSFKAQLDEENLKLK